ncbi:hypothetical protein AMS68_001682 [Peltaster fructicola]|uniref:CSC1/OSCA1-like 7TM region domain-containing protein n=1 Tax=Peltaster fructicola TaxID=286661 RepID=A0A6H0XNF0_9PEZI|nr:hypothetical protein AMS68_001682 [Peltaster fructicola]
MGNLQSLLSNPNGASAGSENATAGTLLASIGYSFAAFALQTAIFIILRDRLTRIYRPKSYLVPERQRMALPPTGLIEWIKPVFTTSNMTLIQRCGLDAYFFLRYLRMLLKIFVPAGCIILPILLPINSQGGGGKQELNILNITNIGEDNKGKTYWAHLVIGILFIIWVGYVLYKELRGYIRVRQAYLTSPQHRIRASATTVLVTGIPKKWLTLQALEGLYDVFPGGIRNIWINRNYDELSNKVEKRNNYAKQLESAETNLLKLCQKANKKALKAAGKPIEQSSHEMTPVGSNEHVDDRPISQDSLIPTSIDESAVKSAPDSNKTTEIPEYVSGSKIVEGITFWRKKTGFKQDLHYDTAYNMEYDQAEDNEAAWRRYIKPNERETIRLPVVGWLPALPLVGKKVDRIYHLRCELARLNLEVETDQKHTENFPLMSSAFIQFNHQVAAHMACQSVNHHVPLQMAPRLVEISPDDVIWDNMSIKWWERYVRTLAVLGLSVALIILYVVPVSFSAALANLGTIGTTYPSLSFLNDLTTTAKSVIQGIGPPLILSITLLLVPMIYGFLVKLQGVPTGNDRELGVQNWYFGFLFIQVFLVASIATGLLSFFSLLASKPDQAVTNIGNSLPQAANYFLSYITVQALGNSASALLQIRLHEDKWKRQTTLSNIQWGSFFPPFTNFAVIGIIYSVIAPVIIPFVVLVFGIYWVVYRYNVLYVYDFKHDTGGLLFPTALNQLFVGIYFLCLCLIGLFFTAVNDGQAQAVPQGIIMVVVLVLCIIYQWLLNTTFGPLLRYMPITLEDDAVLRDEEFARVQAEKFATQQGDEPGARMSKDIEDQLREKEEADERADEAAEEKEKHDIEQRRRSTTSGATAIGTDSWHADRTKSWKNDRWRKVGDIALKPVEGVLDLTGKTGGLLNEKLGIKVANEKLGQGIRTVNEKTGLRNANNQLNSRLAGANGLALDSKDPEAQTALGDVLFSGLADELEDLTPDERDLLVRYSFQHSALRARRPVVWIPQDDLGISNDEIRRAKMLSNYLPMSNAGTHLTRKGKVVFEKSPPDFSNIDLISL